MDLFHDVITGVDAGSAVDAFHLKAVSNVDSSGADGDTFVAIDTVATPGLSALYERFSSLQFPSVLASFFVVGNDD